jgi:hypothetical protein
MTDSHDIRWFWREWREIEQGSRRGDWAQVVKCLTGALGIAEGFLPGRFGEARVQLAYARWYRDR